jgi:alpha-galactosidase
MPEMTLSRRTLLQAMLTTASFCAAGASEEDQNSTGTAPRRGPSPADEQWRSWAPRPPLGWNSYNCFGSSVTEDEVRANANYMASHLKKYGWKYIVIDFCWSHPNPGAVSNPSLKVTSDGSLSPMLAMDEFGRLLPAVERFPSAKGGGGFKPLADYVHSLGLKFGIHVMRGIPRQAVLRGMRLKGGTVGLADIVDIHDTCIWLNHMYGVDWTAPGASAYYNGIFELYASWGVDFVKADNISNPYHHADIQAMRKAIDRCGRPIVLSLSSMTEQLSYDEHVPHFANMWRISNDFWDEWDALKAQFPRCAYWTRTRRSGNWPDADMLILGRIALRGPVGRPRWTRFSREEQRTHVTLWSIARSPLMMGGNMTENDEFTLSLLTNPDVIRLNQTSENNREVRRTNDEVIWAAEDPISDSRFVALFNLREEPAVVKVELSSLHLTGAWTTRDLWDGKDTRTCVEPLSASVAAHGVRLFELKRSG